MQGWRNAFEILIYLLWGMCLWQAIRERRPYITIFLGATAFGLLVEHLGASPRAASEFPCSITQTADDPVKYCYGEFMWMPFGVPICIGLAWGVILNTVIRVASKLREIRWVMRPFFAASLGICLDAVMDPVASNFVALDKGQALCKGPGLEMWFWTDDLRKVYKPFDPETTQQLSDPSLYTVVDKLPYCHSLGLIPLEEGQHYHLFDVPLTNFFGWWFVIFVFTFGAQLIMWLAARRWGRAGVQFVPELPKRSDPPGVSRGPLWREILCVVVSILLGAGLTWAVMKYYVNEAYLENSRLLALSYVTMMLLPGPLAFVWYLPRLKRNQPIDLTVVACLLLFMGFFLPPLWWYDMDDQYPLLVFFAPIMVALSVILFSWPYRTHLRRWLFGLFGWRQRGVLSDDFLAPG